MNSEIFLDLHTHSTASDGQYSPTQLVEKAKEKNLLTLALTDHDTVQGISQAKETAKLLGVDFIPGIEISTDNGVEIHMLGYYIDHTNKTLVDKCLEYEQSRANRAERITDYLNRIGIPVDLEEVKTYAGAGAIGRPHFAKWLQDHGKVRSRQEAFDRYLNTPRFLAETDRKKPTPEEAIQLIHDAGGIAVLAHPGLIKLGRRNQELLISSLVAAGLDGIECLYSTHEKKQEEYYMRLALSHNVKITCGSDFHGEQVKPKISLGAKITPQRLPDKYRELFLTNISL